jgi:hypothetical protein
MKQNTNHPQPPPPLIRLSNAAAWKFSVRIFQSLLWHRNSKGQLIVHKVPPVAAATLLGVCTAMYGPEVGAGMTAGAAGAIAALSLPAVRAGFSKGNNPYTNAEQTVVLVVKAEKDGSWKPDTHVKLKGMSPEDTAAFRVNTMVRVLKAANDQGIALTSTPRDAGLYGRYLRDLIAAQNILGIPREQRRRIEVTGRAFFRGFHCVAPPTPPGPGSDDPSAPAIGPANGAQGRMPGGIPAGGQFAAHIHAEPDIRLPGGPDGRNSDYDMK